jgi:hypothetical protein
LIKENNQPAELFYITPVLNKDLISKQEVSGLIVFRIKNTIDSFSVILKNDDSSEKVESLSNFTSDFSEPYLKAEQIAVKLKVKFEREDYSERSDYDSIKKFIELPDNYFDSLFIKYELFADYKRYTNKTRIEDISNYYFLSYNLGNREKIFLQKKYIPALKNSGLIFYESDNYDSSYCCFSKLISADSIFVFNTPDYFDIIYSYSYSMTEIWIRDNGSVNINNAVFYLDKISKNPNYSNRCKAFLQLGNIYLYKYNFSKREDSDARTRAVDYYNKILDKNNSCSESQQDKAIENLRLIMKKE